MYGKYRNMVLWAWVNVYFHPKEAPAMDQLNYKVSLHSNHLRLNTPDLEIPERVPPSNPARPPGNKYEQADVSENRTIFAAHLSSSFIFTRLVDKQKLFWFKLRSKSSELCTFSFISLTGNDLKLQIYKQGTTITT